MATMHELNTQDTFVNLDAVAWARVEYGGQPGVIDTAYLGFPDGKQERTVYPNAVHPVFLGKGTGWTKFDMPDKGTQKVLFWLNLDMVRTIHFRNDGRLAADITFITGHAKTFHDDTGPVLAIKRRLEGKG